MSQSDTSLTLQVHDELTARIEPGDWVVDATSGNGHDSVFLARRIGGTGRVFCLDIQRSALEITRKRLAEADLSDQATLIQCDHAHMQNHLPVLTNRRISAIVFNLGYLPGGDKSCTTASKSSILALDQSLKLLAPGGCISILAYPGHRGGREECESIKTWALQLPSDRYKTRIQIPAARVNPPEWILILF